MSGDTSEQRPAGQPVRVFRLGDEPRDDLRDTTTVEERLGILRQLSERAWALSGRLLPTYSRDRMPVRVTRLS
jgi:hypothetical protein